MRIPTIRGIICRRILVNYRVSPDVLSRLLPPPFRPKPVNGWGMAGVCLIRLTRLRPRPLPGWCGLSSENAAHRVAVEWDEGGETREGVFIPRRDSSSRLSTLAGGRLFPGAHHHACFLVEERDDRYSVRVDSDDGRTHLLVQGRAAAALPGTSVFGSLAEASDFFRRGSLGYSATRTPGEFDGLELRCLDGWHARPLAVERVASSFFGDAALFPPGSVAFDCALLMRGIDHEWHGRQTLRSPAVEACGTSTPAAGRTT